MTLTRPFLLARYEVTQGQWVALGFQVPHNQAYCDDCPVTYLDFYEAAAWCNALSKFEGLEECYDLSDCTGEIGSGCPEGDFYDPGCIFEEGVNPPTILAQNYNCASDVRRHASMYDCDGYRLPTGAEWEYAAKAGTTTNTYNGDITVDPSGLCIDEPVLNDVAWYCFNTGAGNDGWETGLYLHEVCEKEPNPFGLCDMLGNAFEWADYVGDGQPLGGWGNYGPQTDPMGRPWDGVFADIRGGNYRRVTCYTRSAYQFSGFSYGKWASSGFRPVRTLPATAPDAGVK